MKYVYPVIADAVYNYPALKYSLRSLVHQNYPDVVIIGGKPKWLKEDSPKVQWIDLDPQDPNPYHNVIKKIDVAASMFEEFVLMNDDIIFLEPLELFRDTMFSRHWEYLSKRRMLSKPVSTWSKSLVNTDKAFPRAIDYDTHYPWRVDSRKWQDLWKAFDKNGIYQYKSLYGNYHRLKRIPVKDCKIRDIAQLTDWRLPLVSTSNYHERTKAFRNHFNYLPHSPYERTT